MGAGQASFRVRKKVFAYCLHYHDRAGNIATCVKSALGANIDRSGRQPDLYYLSPTIGKHSWFGMRLNATPEIDWGMAKSILKLSYEVVAPRALSKNL